MSTEKWWNRPLVRPGNAWWNKPLYGGESSHFSTEVWKPVELNIVLQFALFLPSGLILDGGLLFSIVLFATLSWWVAAVPILWKRPKTTHKGELIFLRLGFVGFLPLSVVTAPCWGWIYELMDRV